MIRSEWWCENNKKQQRQDKSYTLKHKKFCVHGHYTNTQRRNLAEQIKEWSSRTADKNQLFKNDCGTKAITLRKMHKKRIH
jgi:L-lactate utilization protein LutC